MVSERTRGRPRGTLRSEYTERVGVSLTPAQLATVDRLAAECETTRPDAIRGLVDARGQARALLLTEEQATALRALGGPKEPLGRVHHRALTVGIEVLRQAGCRQHGPARAGGRE